jgi:hypothetical protein
MLNYIINYLLLSNQFLKHGLLVITELVAITITVIIIIIINFVVITIIIKRHSTKMECINISFRVTKADYIVSFST